MNYLRRKLTAVTETKPGAALIETVRGIGYRMGARRTGLAAVPRISTHQLATAGNA